MKRLLAALAAVILFLLPTAHANPSLLESVRPLQINVEQKTVTKRQGTVVIVVEKLAANICTVSNINTKLRYWLTAAHCVDDLQLDYYVNGEKIGVVMRDVINDLAILQTPTQTAPQLKLASKAPDFEDKVIVAAYPLGLQQPLITIGTVANPKIEISGQLAMIINATCAPGCSGASVTSRGKIISVIQFGWSRSFSPIFGGATYEAVAAYKSYFEAE